MSGQEDEYRIDIDALRRQVGDGNFALRPHAIQHAVKEGFTEDAMLSEGNHERIDYYLL